MTGFTVTITVADKQRGPRSEKTGKYGPWKIAATSGITYKAWDDVANDIHLGRAYDCRGEVVTRGEYTDSFIKHAVQAKNPEVAGNGPSVVRNGPEHGMILKESFQQLALGKTAAQILDWWVLAEEIYDRLKSPKVKQADFPTEETF